MSRMATGTLITTSDQPMITATAARRTSLGPAVAAAGTRFTLTSRRASHATPTTTAARQASPASQRSAGSGVHRRRPALSRPASVTAADWSRAINLGRTTMSRASAASRPAR